MAELYIQDSQAKLRHDLVAGRIEKVERYAGTLHVCLTGQHWSATIELSSEEWGILWAMLELLNIRPTVREIRT